MLTVCVRLDIEEAIFLGNKAYKYTVFDPYAVEEAVSNKSYLHVVNCCRETPAQYVVDGVKTQNERSESEGERTPHDIHDLTYRRLFEASPMVVELIQSFIHEKWVEEVDAAHIKPVNSDFVTALLKARETDLLYEVDIQGEKVLFCIMIELQSTVDYFMAFRILEYKMLYSYRKEVRRAML
jgi:hypothetical protein